MSAMLEQFAAWRAKSRDLLSKGVAPGRTEWKAAQSNLFETDNGDASLAVSNPAVPGDFFALAKRVSCHRDEDKWALLYTALWRLTHGEKHLLKLSTDDVVHRLNRMAQQVGRDAHKAKSFIRFKSTEDEEGERYISWHQPDHYVLGLIGPFFERRFNVMRWSVFTPDESMHWNGETLFYGDGLPSSLVTHDDDFERVWKAYYKSTFNPARVKIGMMKREMPVRYWHTMPETELIPDLLAEAENRVRAMIDGPSKG